MIRIVRVAILGLAVVACGAKAGEEAERAFASGDFSVATVNFEQQVAVEPKDSKAVLGLARLRLYLNRLDEAKALQAHAASLGASAEEMQRLEHEIDARTSANQRYAHALDRGIVAIPFVALDPLPAIEVSVNGRPATFIVDTGAPEVVLDPGLARDAGVQLETGGVGTFGGGRRATVQRGVLRSLKLGALALNDVHVSVLPSAGGLRLFPDRKVDGIVGMALFSHFRVTIDYRERRLIFEPFLSPPLTGVTAWVSIWFVGDHFIFARAKINDAAEGLFLIDTGLAGGGIDLTRASLDAAHITLDEAHASTGVGGGGPVKVVPFVAQDVRLGSLVAHDVHGLYSPEGNPLAIFPFTAAGLLSHGFFRPYAVTFDIARMQLLVR